MPIELEFIAKPGCHLCDQARDVINDVLMDFPMVKFTEQNMLESQDLVNKYSEEIPVLLINDTQFSFWKVDADKLRTKLQGMV